jgi:hypothetical protein
MELSNRKFELIDNDTGLASAKTLMVFDSSSSPFKASYRGPNIEYGHAIVSIENDEVHMLYHSLSKNGDLSAGSAKVTLSESDFGNTEMTLNWHWLTGDLSSGISKWKEVNA